MAAKKADMQAKSVVKKAKPTVKKAIAVSPWAAKQLAASCWKPVATRGACVARNYRPGVPPGHVRAKNDVKGRSIISTKEIIRVDVS